MNKLSHRHADHRHKPAGGAENAGSARSGRRGLVVALMLTAAFTLAELVGGYLANSLALLADAGHMFSDTAAIALSLFAVRFSQRPATPERTYGYFRGEILAALLNGAMLILISLGIIYEAYGRLISPPEVRSGLMLLVAAFGLLANVAAALMLHRSQHESLNVRAAFLHVMGDIAGSVGAIAAGILMWRFRWYLADPVISLLVSALILYSSWRLVRYAVEVLLEGTPSHINVTAMRQELARVPGVESIHDLHVWTLMSGVHMMSCHAIIDKEENYNGVLQALSRLTRERFHINHTTIQVEEQGLAHCGERNCQ